MSQTKNSQTKNTQSGPFQAPGFEAFFKNSDFSKMFENYQAMPFDMAAFMETQRKNMQALGRVQQMTVESIQSAAQQQSEMLSRMMEDHAAMMKEMMAEGTPEAKMSRNTKLVKSLYERTVANLQELSDQMNQSGREASDVINKRITATMTEMQTAMEKAQKKAA